jgi:hypothetical protein
VVLKSLGCLNGDKINIQNEVGRKMGCGVGDPPNGKNFKKSFLVDVYQRLTQIIVWKPLKDFANSLHFADSYVNFSFQHTK